METQNIINLLNGSQDVQNLQLKNVTLLIVNQKVIIQKMRK